MDHHLPLLLWTLMLEEPDFVILCMSAIDVCWCTYALFICEAGLLKLMASNFRYSMSKEYGRTIYSCCFSRIFQMLQNKKYRFASPYVRGEEEGLTLSINDVNINAKKYAKKWFSMSWKMGPRLTHSPVLTVVRQLGSLPQWQGGNWTWTEQSSGEEDLEKACAGPGSES